MVKKINVRSFDFDGCLFNRRYVGSLASKNRLVDANKDYLDRVTRSIRNGKFDEIVLMVGSNRQSKRVDAANTAVMHEGRLVEKESCFPALEKLLGAIQSKVKNIHCRIDGYLLADTYGKVKPGTNFKNAVANNKKFKFADWVFDGSKLSVLYAQIHKLASENPKARITFDFYDDRKTILKPLHDFFSKYREAVPRNVKLRLHHYAGERITNYKPIKGAGNIDHNFEENVRYMAKLAGCDVGKYRGEEYPFLRTLRVTRGIPLFLAKRQLTRKQPEPIQSGLTQHSMFGYAGSVTSSEKEASNLSQRIARTH